MGLVNEVFAVDAAIDPCETLAARHKVVGRTVKQFLLDATHHRFEVLQADIIDPSWGLRPSLDHGLHGPPSPLRVFVFLGPGGKKVSLRSKGRPC